MTGPGSFSENHCVESFSIELTGFPQFLNSKNPPSDLETALLSRLENPVRLLRWAVVKIEADDPTGRFCCEGAYLKNAG
jgi:hypothetical protein